MCYLGENFLKNLPMQWITLRKFYLDLREYGTIPQSYIEDMLSTSTSILLGGHGAAFSSERLFSYAFGTPIRFD